MKKNWTFFKKNYLKSLPIKENELLSQSLMKLILKIMMKIFIKSRCLDKTILIIDY